MAPDPEHDGRARRETLIETRDLTKSFMTLAGEHPVLEGISLTVAAGEIVAVLGKSGSGKSTLLRCIAGLIPPSAGSVSFRGEPVNGPNLQTAMVFQTFALLPWLTVQENVELGLEARGVARSVRHERALRAIDLIGLDGFEGAYPKELSGGMRQRVGFARALVTDPAVLLMDEPFSALDVLTAENLRGELLELWASDEFPTQSIVIVTHNIEEAVLLADRVVILGTNPGRIREEMAIALPRPRDRGSVAFRALVDRIYAVMTESEATTRRTPAAPTPGNSPLPHASVDALSGLAEVLLRVGDTTVAGLADELGFEVDDLLPLLDALEVLGFARMAGNQLALTTGGRTFAGADIQASKRIFAAAALDGAPLVKAIATAVARSEEGAVPEALFRDLLGRSFSDSETTRQLDVATDWGRYAEQFTFDADRATFVVDPDHELVLSAEPGR